jgi:thioredoxin 1
VLSVTDETFATTVLGADTPVVVDVWAQWCPPCRVIERSLVELAEEFGDRIAVVALNADDSPAVARTYGVMSLPTLLVFTSGELVGRVVGARAKSVLRETIRAYAAS